MLTGRLLLVLSVAALCSIAAPAMADMSVQVQSVDHTQMTITAKPSVNNVTAEVTATNPTTDALDIKIYNGVSSSSIDGVYLHGYSMDLTLNFVGSGNNYSATGLFTLKDRNGTNDDIQASFKSTTVTFSAFPYYGGMLVVGGGLKTVTGESSILVGPTDPWIFKGDGLSGSSNADGDPLTIKVSDPSAYSVGTLLDLHMPITGFGSPSTLQGLFAAMSVGQSFGNGTINATIAPVPVPAAVLLGFLGLGTAGLKLRKSV